MNEPSAKKLFYINGQLETRHAAEIKKIVDGLVAKRRLGIPCELNVDISSSGGDFSTACSIIEELWRAENSDVVVSSYISQSSASSSLFIALACKNKQSLDTAILSFHDLQFSFEGFDLRGLKMLLEVAHKLYDWIREVFCKRVGIPYSVIKNLMKKNKIMHGGEFNKMFCVPRPPAL